MKLILLFLLILCSFLVGASAMIVYKSVQGTFNTQLFITGVVVLFTNNYVLFMLYKLRKEYR